MIEPTCLSCCDIKILFWLDHKDNEYLFIYSKLFRIFLFKVIHTLSTRNTSQFYSIDVGWQIEHLFWIHWPVVILIGKCQTTFYACAVQREIMCQVFWAINLTYVIRLPNKFEMGSEPKLLVNKKPPYFYEGSTFSNLMYFYTTSFSICSNIDWPSFSHSSCP